MQPHPSMLPRFVEADQPSGSGRPSHAYRNYPGDQTIQTRRVRASKLKLRLQACHSADGRGDACSGEGVAGSIERIKHLGALYALECEPAYARETLTTAPLNTVCEV